LGFPEPACFGFLDFQPESFNESKLLFSHVTPFGRVVRDALGISLPARLAV
jgi:hypothetical protein